MSKKYVFYLKGVPRAIAMTDQNDMKPLDQCAEELNDVWSDVRSFSVSNGRDVLLLKPSDVAAIHITDLNSKLSDFDDFTDDGEELLLGDDDTNEQVEEEKEVEYNIKEEENEKKEKNIEIDDILNVYEKNKEQKIEIETNEDTEIDDFDLTEDEDEENNEEEQQIEFQLNKNQNEEVVENKTQEQPMIENVVEQKKEKNISVEEIVKSAKGKKTPQGGGVISIEPIVIPEKKE